MLWHANKLQINTNKLSCHTSIQEMLEVNELCSSFRFEAFSHIKTLKLVPILAIFLP